MADQVDQAIAAAAIAEAEQPVIEIPVQMASSRRMAAVLIPPDATDAELVDLAGWLLTTVRAHVRASRPTSPIIVPKRIRDA